MTRRLLPRLRYSAEQLNAMFARAVATVEARHGKQRFISADELPAFRLNHEVLGVQQAGALVQVTYRP